MSVTIRTQESCYLSTPNHIRSFAGFFWIHCDKGCLRLTSDSLSFIGRKNPIHIPLTAIVDVSLGHFSRLLKPIRLDYIAIKHDREGREETILLTPTHSHFTPVWKSNELVSIWMSLLNEIIQKLNHQGSLSSSSHEALENTGM